MKTFFDIATPAEIEKHFGYSPSPEEIREHREYYVQDADTNNQLLFWLFLDRGDTKTAEAHLNKIQNPSCRLDATMLAYESQPA